MDIRNAPVFYITMLLNPGLALRMIAQLHPDRHPHNVKFIVNGDDKHPFVIDYDENNGILPTADQIEKVILLYENSIKLTPKVRGMRFDTSFESDTVIINLEMQLEREMYIDYRMHLSSSQIMVFQSESGAKFNELKPIYVTFLCVEDPYGLGLRKYTWETICRETPGLRQLYSPQWTVYNASGDKGDVSINIEDLLDYLKDPNAYDMSKVRNQLVVDLHAAAQRTLMDGRLRQIMASSLVREQSIEARGRDEGIAIGRVEEGQKAARAMHRLGIPIITIAAELDHPKEIIQQWIAPSNPTP
ncbi:hypothetical protein AGMMS49992_26090 [Clostridia bacterium]|nr:hypothetical protein AGMMS49992_26090 [Clostridia bacterium]